MIDQVRAAMFGHAIADAMGVPVEFRDRITLASNPVTGYLGYGSHAVPAGTWSDDTSMNLAALDSLSQGVDFADMMQRFCAWKTKAAYTATDEVFDMGIATNTALSRFQRGTPALLCGCGDEYDNGNGSLMRIIPAILFCKYRLPNADTEAHIQLIHDVSRLTHSHPRSMTGCGIYYFVMMELLARPHKQSIESGLLKAQQYYQKQDTFSHYLRLMEPDFAALPESEIQSSGYVVATLEAAIWCVLNTNSFRECILKAVNLGSDTDTVAAVAGGLAGVLYGMEGIPEAWYQGLIRHEEIEKLCQSFCQSAGAPSCKRSTVPRQRAIW